MGKQIPNWLFGGIIVVFTIGFISLLGTAIKPAPQGRMIGKEAPALSGKSTDGKTINLADYKGKVVLVNFWATWCGPCRVEIPDLVRLQKDYGDKGFVVIGVSGDDELSTAAEFAKANQMTYPIIHATRELMAAFGNPPGLPTSYLINKAGKIVWEQEGVDTSKSMYAVLQAEIEPRL